MGRGVAYSYRAFTLLVAGSCVGGDCRPQLAFCVTPRVDKRAFHGCPSYPPATLNFVYHASVADVLSCATRGESFVHMQDFSYPHSLQRVA